MILYNEFEPFSKLGNSEFYNDFKTFSKLVHENENVTTNKVLGSLEILAIKNNEVHFVDLWLFRNTDFFDLDNVFEEGAVILFLTVWIEAVFGIGLLFFFLVC